MITVEPTPKKCVVVFRDSNDNYVKSHEIYSPRDIDTLRDGAYTSYSYYVKDDVFSIQNIENFKETQFVVEADQNGFIPTKSELYVSNSSNFDVLFFRPSGTLNQRMRAEFTVVETEVIFVGGSNASGINSCNVTLDNVFNTYDIHPFRCQRRAQKGQGEPYSDGKQQILRTSLLSGLRPHQRQHSYHRP